MKCFLFYLCFWRIGNNAASNEIKSESEIAKIRLARSIWTMLNLIKSWIKLFNNILKRHAVAAILEMLGKTRVRGTLQ